MSGKSFDRGRRARVAVTAALLAAAGLAPAVHADTLLVANRSSHEILFIDAASGETSARIETGAGPHLLSNVAGRYVLASGYGQFPRPHAEPVTARPPFVSSLNSRVTLIDVVERRVVFDRVLEGCRKPHASWIVGDRGYFTCEDEQRIRVISLADGHDVTSYDTRQSGSHVLSYDADSRMLGVSNTDSGSLTLIDVESGEPRVVELAPGSEGALAIGGRIWVANTGDGSVSIVDPETARETARSDGLCAFPIAFSSDSQGSVWLACFASAELLRIDADTLAVTERFKLPDHPLNLVAHPGRRVAFVSYPRKNAVGEIDLETGDERRRIRVGIEPDGLRWLPSRQAARAAESGPAPLVAE